MAQSIQTLLLSTLVDQVISAESDVLDLILSDYASGTLTSEAVFARVGEIAGMRRLARKVQSSIKGEQKLKTFNEGDAPPPGE